MKKKIFLMIGLCALLLTGCGNNGNNENTPIDDKNNTIKGEIYLDVANAGQVIYFNPETNKKCSEADAVSTTGTKTGCMKWYIINENDKNVNMILDHNTTARVAWNSSGSNATGMNEVATALSNDTASWNSSLNARLIEANEIARITGNTTFDQTTTTASGWFYFDSNSATQVADSTNKSAYAWLYDYIANCTGEGCNIEDLSAFGYWTSSPVAGGTYYAWDVTHRGDLNRYYVDSTPYGVRPVISVSKSIIY